MKKATKPRLKPVRKTPVAEITPEQQIVGAVFLGKVFDYSAKTGTMAVQLEAPLAVGETIRVKGHATDLTQRVERLTVARVAVQSAVAGEDAAVTAADRVKVGDAVYKL